MTHLLERRQAQRTPSKYEDVQVEFTRLMFEDLAGTVVGGSLGIVGGTTLLALHYADPWLRALAWCMALLCTIWIGVVLSFKRLPPESLTVRSAQRWERGYGVILACCTASIGLSTLHNYRFHDAVGIAWCTIGVLGTASGINSRLASRPWIANLSSMVMLTALAWSLLHAPEVLIRANVLSVLSFAYACYVANRAKFTMLTEQIRTRRQLNDLAQHDALTGLANRRLFEERLSTAYGTYSAPFAVLYLDLDGFKRVNDTFGHATGDALLRSVSGRLRAMLRETDLLARLGGDEFAILQSPEASEGSAAALAARINAAIGTSFEIDGHQLQIGASVGIALSTLRQNGPAHLLSEADKALYRVKQAGRGGFCLAQA